MWRITFHLLFFPALLGLAHGHAHRRAFDMPKPRASTVCPVKTPHCIDDSQGLARH